MPGVDAMTIYVVAQIRVDDRDAYATYESGFMEILSQLNGSPLSVEEAPEVLEGNWG